MMSESTVALIVIYIIVRLLWLAMTGRYPWDWQGMAFAVVTTLVLFYAWKELGG